MNENFGTSIDGLSTSCSSCCLSQNIIESLKQRIEKLESEMEKKNLALENINLKDEKQIMLQQFQQMQLAINEEKNKQINEIKNFGLNNQSKEELEALRKENKLLKEKNEQIEKNDLEKINDNKNLFDLNTQLNEQLEELNIETAEYKEKHQLILKELSDYQEKFKDLSFRYNLKKSRNAKGFNDILEFNQMKLENTNLIKKLKESDEKINKNNEQIEKFEQTNASLNEKISELSSQLNLLKKKLRFVNLPNKICGIWPTGCCGNRCIDSNISNGVCKSLNEYVNVNNDGKIKYNKENNKYISLRAYHFFKEGKLKFSNKFFNKYNCLFYFEVKMIKELTDQLNYAMIGIRNFLYKFNLMILLSNYYSERINEDYNQKISWNNGDIFGCGDVFPSDENDDEHPYVFFTKNGNKIGSDIELEFDNYLYPTVGLKSCSVETNFGNDLVVKPFCYDISEFI